MRSGISHLKRKMGNDDEQVLGNDVVGHEGGAPADPAGHTPCELDQPRWAVVSFDRCYSKSLSYSEAIEMLHVLEDRRVPGLCIITAEAASHFRD